MNESSKLLLLFGGLLSIACSAWTWSAEPAAEPLGTAGGKPSLDQPCGWRGDGSGRFPGAKPATEWSATKNVRWAAVVGKSYSSPIVTAECALVTSEPNLLVCVNRADGKIRWKIEVTPADVTDPQSRKVAEKYEPPKAGSGLVAATPITDGRYAYAVFANGIVCAVDLVDGRRKWAICIQAEQTTGYGRSSSPIIVAGKLIVHMSNLYAFDPASGKQLWVNTDAQSSYGTPVELKAGGADLIVTPVGDVVRADDGKGVASGIGHTGHSSPVSGNGLVYFADGMISAIRLSPAFKDDEAWNAMITGDVFGSPVLQDGLLFLVNDEGELYVFDANGKGSQEPIIAGRALFEEGGGYASLTLAGKYLFLNSNAGEIVVLEATREAKLVHKNKLAEGSGSSPVFSGKEMFLRAGDKLLCIAE